MWRSTPKVAARAEWRPLNATYPPAPHYAPNVARHIWCGKAARRDLWGRCRETGTSTRQPSIFRSVSLATRFKAVLDDREDFLALLMFVAGIADAVSTFLRDGVGAIAMKDAEIEVVLLRQMPHAGDECLIERAIVGPFGEHFVDLRLSRFVICCASGRVTQ